MRYAVAMLVVCTLQGVMAQTRQRPEFKVQRADRPPKIDGNLEDEIWKEDPLPLSEWISYNPLYGDKSSQRTEVRVAYDKDALYFAFHCFDEEPHKIKSTVSRRDSIFRDDWVGLSLDSAGSGQSSYHMMVNPNGIQMDALNTASAGESWEADWVWDSAGRITADGYTIEIRLPLQSIRFKGGSDVKMGILFWRRVSRLGVSSSWPDIPPGQWVFNRHALLSFADLEQPRLIEALPSVTYSLNQSRGVADAWNRPVQKGDVGLSVKYGLTSAITLDATINPDFSQVESDTFQVLVNQRFPIYYAEKRPFFMEGMGLFSLAGSGGDANMRTAVHTRRIINPWVGAKLTGSTGRMTFGLLATSDQTPAEAPIGGENKLFAIGRALYGLGESNYIGGIFTETDLAGTRNRVAGGDFFFKYAGRQQFTTTFLLSETSLSNVPDTRGVAGQISYNYNSRRFGFATQVEHYDKDFRMDTAFYNQTGFTSGWAYAEINFYPSGSEGSWLKRVTPFTWNKLGRDRIQNGNTNFTLMGVRLSFTRQGFFRVDRGFGHEPWAGQLFKTGQLRFIGSVQIARWLNLEGFAGSGWDIFYDAVNPFQGRSRTYNIDAGFQPTSRFKQDIGYRTVRFDRASDSAHVFTVHIVNLRSTYQLNRHFFVRGTGQFDSASHRILTDFLASYELVPGTVLHVGYGSLMEKRDLSDEALVSGAGRYLTVSRGLFFKASYLYRF
jgi:hypothetical protein